MRPVNLIGSASAQKRAQDLILEIVESDQKGVSVKDLQTRDREDSYGKVNDQIIVPGEAVGMIIGKGMVAHRIIHIRANIIHRRRIDQRYAKSDWVQDQRVSSHWSRC